MTNARIERLTREALGPQRKQAYSPCDDTVLRAAGIVILVLVVIVFASWPREEASDVHAGAARPSSPARPAAHPGNDGKSSSVRKADYSPLY